jgi:hypothetical protein
MIAGFHKNFESQTSYPLKIAAIEPVMILAETLVPDLTMQFPSESNPEMFSPYVTRSGLIIPNPLVRSHVVIPLELKLATLD